MKNQEIEMLPIESIKPYEKNPRKISEKAIDAVANSLRLYGFQQPIVIDKNNVIVAGHTRYQAALKLGILEVPCKKAKHTNGEWLTESECKAYRIADNKTGEYSQWDNELLSVNFDEIKIEMPDFGLEELTGYKDEIILQGEEYFLDDVQTDEKKEIENMQRVDDLVYCGLYNRYDLGKGECPHKCLYCYIRTTTAKKNKIEKCK